MSACILLASVLLSLPLAYGAAPDVPLMQNPIVLMMCAIVSTSTVIAVASALFKWGWKAKYYGVSLLCVGGISFMAIVPCLAVVLYGSAPYWLGVCGILFYGCTHYFWCRKFAILYKRVFDDDVLRNIVFQEEAGAVYYLRSGDDFLLEKHFKFSQTPADRYFVLFMVLALLMISIMGPLRAYIGVPFVHVFLAVAMLPVSWMSIGLAFRAYLIFYLYPGRIKKATGKDVYVDLASKHRPLVKRPRAMAACAR